MRLELGAGERPTPGFTHMDERELDDIEIVGDVSKLTQFVQPESCDELRATHLLEHFSWRDTEDILSEWHRALKPGGFIYLEVPNLHGQMYELSRGMESEEKIVELIYGSQDYEGNYHKAGFTDRTLCNALLAAGFVNVDCQSMGLVVVAKAFKDG